MGWCHAVGGVQVRGSRVKIDLAKPCTQARFAAMVGISQPAVNQLLNRGTLTRGETAGQWLLDYCTSQREQNAGNADGENLAYERAVATRVARERDEIRLAVDQRTFAPVSALEQALATLGVKVVSILHPLHIHIQKRCPALTPDDVLMIQREVAKACAAAESAALAVLVPKDEDEDESEGEPA